MPCTLPELVLPCFPETRTAADYKRAKWVLITLTAIDTVVLYFTRRTLADYSLFFILGTLAMLAAYNHMVVQGREEDYEPVNGVNQPVVVQPVGVHALWHELEAQAQAAQQIAANQPHPATRGG